MSGKDKETDAEARKPLARKPAAEKPKRCYWVVAGVVCWTRQQMIEAVAGMRDTLDRR